jgi:hypothetical protein
MRCLPPDGLPRRRDRCGARSRAAAPARFALGAEALDAGLDLAPVGHADRVVPARQAGEERLQALEALLVETLQLRTGSAWSSTREVELEWSSSPWMRSAGRLLASACRRPAASPAASAQSSARRAAGPAAACTPARCVDDLGPASMLPATLKPSPT